VAFRLKRAYEPAARDDGYRVLVERLWPRGVRKEALGVAAWLRDVAPSAALRTWYAHEPARWDEFQRRYGAELKTAPAAEIVRELAGRGRKEVVTLVFSAHDAERNSAAVLKRALEGQTISSGSPRGTSARATRERARRSPRTARR